MPQETDDRDEVLKSNPDAPVSSDERTENPSRRTGGSRDQIGMVLIEENPDEEAGSQKDSVTITSRTMLFELKGQDLTPVEFDDFKRGQRARAWYVGPVAESYPRQATARLIVIHSPVE